MRLVELRAKEVKTLPTKYGDKILIVASGDLKSEIKIWRPLTDNVAQGIKANQFFTAAVDSQGKYSPIANPEPAQTYIPESPYSPLATPAPVRKMGFTATPAPELVEVPNPSPKVIPSVHPHIAKMAQVMAQCVSAIRAEIPGLDAESEQKYATSLFIQAAKEIF